MNTRNKMKVDIALLVALLLALAVAMTLRFYLPMACLSFAALAWLFLTAD